GSWHVVSSGDPSVTNVLSSVACTSARFCVAVGTTRGERPRPFVETWHGDRWAVTPVRGYPGPTSLSSVACLSESFCVAVGQHSSGDVVLTAAASFDGKSWRLERSPSVGVFSNLTGVACVAEDWCAAVGDRIQGQGSRTLVLRRESGWSLRPSPSLSFISGYAAVSCVSSSACVAVGARRDRANPPFLTGWGGASRTLSGPPSP